MTPKRLIPLLLCALLIIFLSSCGPTVWVERLQIEVNDDISGHVRFIVLESRECIREETRDGGRPFVETVRTDWVEPCGVETQAYLATTNAEGFIATASFSGKGELEYTLTCIPILAEWVRIYPLDVKEGLLGTGYALRIDLFAPSLFREVQVTLPGRMYLEEPAVSTGISVTAKLVSRDTVLWQIPTTGLDACEPLPATELTASVQPTPTSPPATEPLASAQPTPTSPPITETATPVLSLIARSHKSAIRVEWILSILGVLVGSGLTWRVIEARRKKDG